jgi:hypothetical protein
MKHFIYVAIPVVFGAASGTLGLITIGPVCGAMMVVVGTMLGVECRRKIK